MNYEFRIFRLKLEIRHWENECSMQMQMSRARQQKQLNCHCQMDQIICGESHQRKWEPCLYTRRCYKNQIQPARASENADLQHQGMRTRHGRDYHQLHCRDKSLHPVLGDGVNAHHWKDGCQCEQALTPMHQVQRPRFKHAGEEIPAHSESFQIPSKNQAKSPQELPKSSQNLDNIFQNRPKSIQNTSWSPSWANVKKKSIFNMQKIAQKRPKDAQDRPKPFPNGAQDPPKIIFWMIFWRTFSNAKFVSTVGRCFMDFW